MKNILSMVFGLVFLGLWAQQENVKVGDELQTAAKEAHSFKSIYIPRKNIILKRGGQLHLNSIENTKVRVVNLEKNKKGEDILVLKRVDGRRFFNQWTVLKANAKMALDLEELIKINPHEKNKPHKEEKNEVIK